MASPRQSSEDRTSQPTEKKEDKLDKYRNERYPSCFKKDPAPKQNPELKKRPEPNAGQDGTVQGEQKKEAHGPREKGKTSRLTAELEEIKEEDSKLGALDQKANNEPKK